jgi:hypothetical protein
MESCSFLSHWSPQNVSPFVDIGKIVSVNFEVGALEKWIKLKGTEGPHVSHHSIFRPCVHAVATRPPVPTVFRRPSFPPVAVFRVAHGSRRHSHVCRPPITPNVEAGFIFPSSLCHPVSIPISPLHHVLFSHCSAAAREWCQGPQFQNRKCSSQHDLQVCKVAKILDVGSFLFKRSKQSYSNTIPDFALSSFRLILIPLRNSITSPIFRDGISMSNGWKFNISSSIWNTGWPFLCSGVIAIVGQI